MTYPGQAYRDECEMLLMGYGARRRHMGRLWCIRAARMAYKAR